MNFIVEHNEFKKPLENVPMAYLQLETGVDPITRSIYWDNEVSEMLPFFIKQRIELISQFTNDDTTPINFYLSTVGGNAESAFGVVDILEKAKMPVNIIVNAVNMSAGVIILLGATGKKISYKNTRFMLHQVSSASQGKLDEIETTTAEIKAIQERIYKFLVAKTKKDDIKFWKKLAGKSDKYFDANFALELGIIDEIW